MQFPNYERVIYEHNPLNEVLCELCFPSILTITSKQPVEFHEKVRNQYPSLQINRPIDLPSPINEETNADILESLSQMLASETLYTFTSEDLEWQVSLSKDLIRLATKNYRKYEEFQERLQYIVKVFEEIYKPSSYIKIRLKYQDLILPSSLDVQHNWKLLVKQPLIPELYSQELANSVKGMRKLVLLEFEESKVSLTHGIVEINDLDRGIINEEAYFIDTDFFTEERIIGAENVYRYLTKFNQLSGKIFRWCITDELHQLLKPQSVKES